MRLVALGYKDYTEYLRSSHWKQTRARYFASEHPQECICGETEGLQLHHLTYDRVGAEELADLTPLCGRCHRMIHALVGRGEIGLDFAGLICEYRAQGYEQQDPVAQRRVTELEERRAECEARELMPIEERLRLDRHEASERGIDISMHTRMIERQLQKIIRKINAAA